MEAAVARHRSVLILCSTLSLVAGGLIGFFTPHPRGPSISVTTPDPTATPLPTPTPSPLRVYVSGAVAVPAVYRLFPDSLVADAIEAAGGPTSDADLDQINLAQELRDQQHVHVPRIGEETQPLPPGGSLPADGPILIDINAATLAELDTLPHIGPSTAQEIVQYRETYGPFQSIEEIMEVPGIGPAIFEEIQHRITVGE